MVHGRHNRTLQPCVGDTYSHIRSNRLDDALVRACLRLQGRSFVPQLLRALTIRSRGGALPRHGRTLLAHLDGQLLEAGSVFIKLGAVQLEGALEGGSGERDARGLASDVAAQHEEAVPGPCATPPPPPAVQLPWLG